MIDILLIVQIVISVLLITVILIQRTGSDSLSGLSGGGNTGVVSARAAATFLSRTTIILATIFMINSIILANLSTKSKNSKIIEQIESEIESSRNPEVE